MSESESSGERGRQVGGAHVGLRPLDVVLDATEACRSRFLVEEQVGGAWITIGLGIGAVIGADDGTPIAVAPKGSAPTIVASAYHASAA